jgi:hypothetical protein
MDSLRLVLALAAAAMAASCGSSDPDVELRALIAAAEEAAEARDGGFFRDLIAPSYRDSRGTDRDGMINLIRGYFLTHSRIEIVTNIDEIALEGADAARIVLRAGMVGQRAGQSLLGGLEGELTLLELELIKQDSDWRVIGASWQRAAGDR